MADRGWEAALAGLFDVDVTAAVATDVDSTEPIHPFERLGTEPFAPNRLGEYRTGRACARRAMAERGRPNAVVPRNHDRSPCWPAGIAGSISHCAGLVAAVVTETTRAAALGLDIETWAALPADVEEAIRASGDIPCALVAHPSMLLFCAKEALYKCYYPVVGRFLDFTDAAVAFRAMSPVHGKFQGRLHDPVRSGSDMISAIQGRWCIGAGFVAAGAWLDSRRA